ncbi:reverse transcriptase domain-containing protein [Tanacetum coccineum]|uniref:Reverse transcriptase domain-containing protein n=1 Tax=Tanacetum coccineum TaxID=301880 RepID=A0ABQ5CWI2_9ASTR
MERGTLLTTVSKPEKGKTQKTTVIKKEVEKLPLTQDLITPSLTPCEPDWERAISMSKEGIVLGHKISKSGLEVDRAKVEVIAKLNSSSDFLSSVRSYLGHSRDFAIGQFLGKEKNKRFSTYTLCSKTMNEAQTHYTTTEKELLAVVYAFEKFRHNLVIVQKA